MTVPTRWLVFVPIAALVLGASSTSAQGTIELDLEQHLPGCVAAAESAFNDLYDLQPYERWHGKRVTRKKLAELQESWAAVARERSPLAWMGGLQLKRHPVNTKVP